LAMDMNGEKLLCIDFVTADYVSRTSFT